jgi:hypothetical protein
MRTSVTYFLASAAILLVASPVAAQPAPGTGDNPAMDSTARAESAKRQERPPATWSIDAVAGLVTEGPADDLMGAMRASGFGDRLCSFGCVDYPDKSSSLVHTFWLAARHRMGMGSFHAGLAGGVTEFPEVRGGHLSAEPGPTEQFLLNTDSRINTLAAMAWLEVVPGLWNWSARIGAGPSLNQASVKFTDTGAPDNGTFRKTNAGYVAEIAVTIPRTTPVYCTALAQYRQSGSVRVAGWTRTRDSGASCTFASTNVRMNHAFLGLGLGVRF